MKNRNTFKFLFAAALIGGSFAVSAMEEQFKRLKIDSDQEKLGEALCKAAENGYLDELIRLIKADADVNHQDAYGNTPLINAARYRHSGCARALLAAQADPNIAGIWKQTALMFAAQGFHDIVELLIEANADLNIQDEDGSTALMHAWRSPKCLRLLITAKANLEIKTNDGLTALMFAAAGGNEESTQLLINAGANIHALNNDGKDALALVHDSCSFRCMNLLVDAGADLRPTIKHHGPWNLIPNFRRSVAVAKKQQDKVIAFLWSMKQESKNNGINTDFGIFVAEPLLIAHRQMLEEVIELLQNEETKNQLRNILEKELD